jgi:hypothetical protein
MVNTTGTPTKGYRVVMTHDAQGNVVRDAKGGQEMAFVLDERRAGDIVADYRDQFPKGWFKYEDAVKTI